jgi:hypothetical protein
MERTLLRLLWIAAAVQIAGRALDLRWHATHDEFEATRQQFEAHWLLWIGVAAVLAVAAVAVRRIPDSPSAPGYWLTLAASLIYVPTSVWHFIEHANHNDPEVAHVLLAIWQIAILAGVVMATVRGLRAGRASTA